MSEEIAPIEPVVQDVEAATEPEVVEPWRAVKHKIKVNDQEQELDYDDLLRRAQKATGAERRFEEAAQLKKSLQEAVAEAKKNPLRAIEEFGLKEIFASNPQLILDLLGPDKFKAFAEETIWQDIQNQQKSPEQLELEQLRAWRQKEEAEREAKAKEEEMTKAERQEHELREKYRAQYEETFMSALEKSNLPKTPESVARLSKMMMSAMENGYEPDLKELVEAVEESYKHEHKVLYKDMSAEQLYALLGDDSVKKIKEYDLNRVKSAKASPFTKKTGSAPERLADGLIEEKDFFAKIRQRAGLSS
jgi:hypothetical protein